MDALKLRTLEKEKIEKRMDDVNINDCTRALLGIVVGRQKDTIFYDYEEKETIGKYIYAELLGKYDEKLGFLLSDDVKESGLLTQAQGACTLDSLISDFKIMAALEREDALQLKKIYEKTIRYLLDNVVTENGYKFNASPYNVDVFNDGYEYVDSMTWVISALLNVINYCETDASGKRNEVKVAFTEAECEKAMDIVAHCVAYLANCFIDITANGEKKLSKGWNFTKNCSEPSLYFTYAVSECYIDIYSTFKQVVDKRNIDEKIEKLRKIPEIVAELEKGKEISLFLSDEDQNSYTEIAENSDEFVKNKKYFDRINGQDGFYYRLADQVKEAAYNAWDLVKGGIDKNFYNYNLSGTVDTTTVESSSSSDALFNNVFVINNIISGGLDEDISDKLAQATEDNEMNRLQSEYDDLLETLQAALQRAIRYNKVLQSRQKSYIINDYYISCNEQFSDEMNKKSQELRKKRIKTFTLSPLLVKTNNLISEFLTKYPQYEMIKYLDELLMKNRSMEGEDYTWIWENGEYHVTSDYYYIAALSSFYKYIDTYESRFRKIETRNEEFKTKLKNEYLKKLRDGGEIYDLTVETQKLQGENDKLREEVSELRAQESEVEKALRELLRKELKENFAEWMTIGVSEMEKDAYEHLLDPDFEATHAKELNFFDGFKKLIVLSFAKTFRERLRYLDVEEKTQDAADCVKGKMENSIKSMITDIVESPDFK